MAYCYVYDEEGRFTGDMLRVLPEVNKETGEETFSLPPQCTLKQPPDGGFYPRFMGTKWVTREEYTLDENNRPILPEEEITNESI
ncbi:hypothetical protein [Bacillus toyonensis]|uniref:hypothetical protein n=1 Tax=Bacillus toyonensis TaxID=155322 RepID=UPI000BF043B4|nr:hypothetical protein [Bacillus toyonensis]PEM64461.1 hypothetical protein CN625_01745 [Bacillus toyonensis]